jgi:hypothetical protein
MNYSDEILEADIPHIDQQCHQSGTERGGKFNSGSIDDTKKKAIPIKIELLDLILPESLNKPAIMINPSFNLQDNKIKAQLHINPIGLSVTLAAIKGPLSIRVRLLEAEFEGVILLGLNPKAVQPSYISSLNLPKLTFKCDVKKIELSSIIKRIDEL